MDRRSGGRNKRHKGDNEKLDKEEVIERRVDIYRKSNLGLCLKYALQELTDHRKINQDLADLVLDQFDRSMARNIAYSQNHVVFSASRVGSYRLITDNWKITLQDVIFSTPFHELEHVDTCTLYAGVPVDITK